MSASTSRSSSSTPVLEARMDDVSPLKRKALSPAENFGEHDDAAPSSPSLTTASSSNTTPDAPRRRPTDEERRVRLEARQARNRQSAQNSRERKKVYMEQLEATLDSLKAENALLRKQQQQDQVVKLSLQSTISSFETRVHSLEALVRELLKAGGYVHLPAILSSASAAKTAEAPLSTATASASSSSRNDTLLTPQVGPATIAAPVSTASGNNLAELSSGGDLLDCALSYNGRAARAVPAAGVLPLSRSNVGDSLSAGFGSTVGIIGSSIVGGTVPLSDQQGATVAGQDVAGIQQQQTAGVSTFQATSAIADQGQVDQQLDITKFIDLQQLDSPAGREIQRHSTAEVQGARAEAFAGASSVSLPGSVASAAAGAIGAGSVSDFVAAQEFSSFKSERDDGPSFSLLNSPFCPVKKSVEETATEALLAEIYGRSQQQQQQDTLAVQEQQALDDQVHPQQDVSFGTKSATGQDDADSWISEYVQTDDGTPTMSMGASSPFDLVDLDVEIEQPLTASQEPDADQLTTASYGAAGHAIDWQRLFASIAA